MEYTTRMGSGPVRAHVNYQCPCGCIGGVIYSSGKSLSKAGACCCGRKLWVGEDAEEKLKPYLDVGVDYEWDLGSVILPWGEVARAAMAWPRAQNGDASDSEAPSPSLVKDPVCGMMIDPSTAAATSTYRNQQFFFCALSCKMAFDANQSRYVPSASFISRLLRR
jgi:YHS domain-containing protein